MFLTIKENEPRLKELAWEMAMLPKPSMHPNFHLLKEEGDFTIDLHAILFFSDGNVRKIELIKLGDNERDGHDVLEELSRQGYWPYFHMYFMRHEYWSHKEIQEVENLSLNQEGLDHAYKIAEEICKKIFSLSRGHKAIPGDNSTWASSAQKIWFCSGPLRNGTEDRSYRNQNLKVFFKKLHEFSKDHLVFDQLPFDRFIEKLIASGFPTEEIFEKFFGRIISSGYIDALYMFKGWQNSGGANFENKKAILKGLHIEEEGEAVAGRVELGHY